MRGADLKHLADTANLARLDLASTRLILETHDDLVSASYASAYSAGQRTLPRSADLPDLACELDAARFAELCRLFADGEDVRLAISGNDLRLRTKQHQAKLRLYPVEPERMPPERSTVAIASVSAKALLAEADLASDFVATDVSRPILTGIRLSISAGTIEVQAFNGMSALFLASVPADAGDDPVSVVLPAQDLVVGLKLVGDAPLSLELSDEGQRLMLRSERSWFACSTLSGQPLDLSPLMRPVDRAVITFSAEQLQTVIRSAGILDGSKQKDQLMIQIIPGNNNNAIVKTAESETGSFSTAITGTIQGSHWYRVSDLTSAARIGEQITLQVPAEWNTPTLIEAGNRTVWVMGRSDN